MLELEHLSKHYGRVTALRDCTFAARRGRILGLLGRNGAGKSTAMRSIFGLVAPDGGSIRWNGAPIGPDQRMRFGYMPEQRGLYPKMANHDQLAYFGQLHGLGRREASQAADRWLEYLGLADRRQAHLEELSHGNQQRVQLATALMHEPELVVLDEPFSGLDPLAVRTLQAVVQDEARRGAAVVFSSHQLDLVEDICEDIAIIDHGTVVLAGRLDDLQRRNPVRYLDIGIRGAPPDWTPPIEGAELVGRRDGVVRLRVPRDLDVATLTRLAQDAGEIEHFRYEPPALADLFLDAVQEPAP